MAINTEKRLLEKIRIALANDIITPYELSVLLHYRSKNQLYMLSRVDERIGFMTPQQPVKNKVLIPTKR